MPVWLQPLLLLVLLAAPGFGVLRWLLKARGGSSLVLVEAVVLIPCLSVLATSFVGIVLAEVGLFRLPLLVAIVALITLVTLALTRRGVPRLAKAPHGRLELAFLATVVLVAAVLYFRPHEYVFGGWDPSTYLSTGASIERTGGILYHDEPFAALTPDEQKAFVHQRQYLDQRFPGLLVADPRTGLISPQFHHLYPTWLAAFRAVGGNRLMLYANPLFGLLSVLMLFILCQRFLPSGAAFAATILLALNLTQIWQARFSTAEILAQLCILTMLYLLMLYWQSGSTAAALLAMLALGMAGHARFDSLLLVPLVALLVYAHNLGRWQRRDWLLVLGGAVVVAHIVLHSIFISFLYRPGLALVTSHLGLIAPVVVVLAVVFTAFRLRPNAFTAFATGPAVRGLGVGAILVLAFYGYFVRPQLGGPAQVADRQNLVVLGWFLTPVGLALAVAGACVLVARARSFAELTLLVVGVVLIALYVKSSHVEKFYMWAVRRYVPVVMPMLCLFAGCTIAAGAAALGRWRRAACAALALVIAAVPLVRGRAVVEARDNAGALRFVTRVAERLDPDAVYICNHYWLAMPLRMLFGLQTYAVSDPDPAKCRVALDFAKRMLGQRRLVYLVDMDRPHVFPDLACLPPGDLRFQFRSSRLRQEPVVPRATEPVELDACFCRLVPLDQAPKDAAVDITWEFEPDWFHVGEGFLRTYNRRIDVVEMPDGERLDPSQAPKGAEVRHEFACWTGRRSALWIPYDPARQYELDLRLAGRRGVTDAAVVRIGDTDVAMIEPGEAFRSVFALIPRGIETGTRRRALLEIISLAPADEKEPPGVLLDRVRLQSLGQ